MAAESINMTLNVQLIKKLREMQAANKIVSEMLTEILLVHREDPQIKVLSMKYFREAFGLSMAAVTPIAGWSGFGGELQDEQIDELINVNTLLQ